jgi:hypothetical protein
LPVSALDDPVGCQESVVQCEEKHIFTGQWFLTGFVSQESKWVFRIKWTKKYCHEEMTVDTFEDWISKKNIYKRVA